MSHGPIFTWELIYQAHTEPVLPIVAVATPNAIDLQEQRQYPRRIIPTGEQQFKIEPVLNTIKMTGSYTPDANSGWVAAGVDIRANSLPTGVLFDNQSRFPLSGAGTTSFSNSTSLTIGTGANRALLVLVSWTGDPGTPSITWNGVALTQLASFQQPDFGCTTAVFGLRNPASGTLTLAGTWSNTQDYALAAVSYSNVVQTSDAAAFPNSATAIGNTSPASVTVIYDTGDAVVGSFGNTANGGVTAIAFTSVNNTEVFRTTTTHLGAAGNRFPADMDNWWQTALSEPPVKTKKGLPAHEQQFAAHTLTQISAVSNVVDLQEQRQVPRPKSTAHLQPALAFHPNPIPADVDGWLTQFLEPQRRLAGLHASNQQFFAFSSLPVVATAGWDDSVEWPPQTKRPGLSASQQPFLAYTPFTPATAVNEDSWHQAWSDPVRLKPGLAASQQQASAFVPVVAAAAFNTFGWISPFAEVLRPKAALTAANQRSLEFVAIPPTATVIGDWPDFAKGRTILAALQSTTTLTQVVVTTPTATVDGWGAPLFEVPKRKAGLTTANQQFLAYTEAAPFTETVTEDRWHQPWSEPVRTKKALPVGEQQFAAFVSVVTTPTPSIDGWGSPFVEVPKPKAGLTAAAQQALAFNPAVFVAAPDAWSNIWHDPPKPKVSINVAAQQALIAIPFVEGIFESKWHQPWSEPVRTKPGLAASQQSAVAYSPFVVTVVPPVDSWFNPFGVLPKAKAGLSTANQQFQAFTEAAPFPETVTESRWHQPWSEPVRTRIDPRRAIALAAPFTAFNPRQPDVSFGYYRALSEPVRFRRFDAAQQLSFARSSFTPIVVSGITMDVTETGDIFNGSMYAFNAPVHCYVSIIEKDPSISGYAGIIEN